jgi:chromosome segregation ATPase
MGTEFHEALAGAANREFGNVQGTMEATRQTLSEMNQQFGAVQAAFPAVVRKAEETTSDQLQSGREQTEALTSLMNGLMTRLQATADQNLNSVRDQLRRVVSDLAESVGTLSRDMMAAAENATKQSQNSAQLVLDNTGAWSESTARRLESLLDKIEARGSDFQKAGQVLMQTHDHLAQTLAQGTISLQNMAEASSQVKAYSTALSSQADLLKGLSQQQAQVSSQLRDCSNDARASFEQHGGLLKEYERVFDDYRKIMDGLDEGLGGIFAEINQGMRDYTQGVANNFREIVKISNQAVPEISKLLQAQVQELSGQLEELSSVIVKSVEGSNGRVR